MGITYVQVLFPAFLPLWIPWSLLLRTVGRFLGFATDSKFLLSQVSCPVPWYRTTHGNSSVKPIIQVPIAHHQGSYYIDPLSLNDIEERGQVLFRYCDAKGNISEPNNPNGSVGSVAGLCNEQKNVMGMMPHPERCADPLWSNTDGQGIFQSLISQSWT